MLHPTSAATNSATFFKLLPQFNAFASFDTSQLCHFTNKASFHQTAFSPIPLPHSSSSFCSQLPHPPFCFSLFYIFHLGGWCCNFVISLFFLYISVAQRYLEEENLRISFRPAFKVVTIQVFFFCLLKTFRCKVVHYYALISLKTNTLLCVVLKQQNDINAMQLFVVATPGPGGVVKPKTATVSLDSSGQPVAPVQEDMEAGHHSNDEAPAAGQGDTDEQEEQTEPEA